MHDETIAIHGGYTSDGTRAVAVPIYQTVAHDFIDAAHAGAVLDMETPGFHYKPAQQSDLGTSLEQRICALEGGTAALVVASGMAAVSYAILTVATAGSNIVVAPQLYGATFTYFAHVLPTLGIEGPLRRRRPRRIDRPADRREHPRGVLRDHRQPGRQHRGPRGGGRRGPCGRRTSDRGQHGGDTTDAQAFRARGRCGRPLADQVRRRTRDHPRWGHRGRRAVPVG